MAEEYLTGRTRLERIESEELFELGQAEAILSIVRGNTALLNDMASQIFKIEQELSGPAPDDTAASVHFVVPTYRDITTGKEVHMALTLANGVISNIPLEFDNLAGTAVPAPDETTAMISTSDPLIASAALGHDGMSIDVTPIVPQVAGSFTVSFADSANVALTATLDCEYVIPPDLTAANVHFRTDEVTTRPLGT